MPPSIHPLRERLGKIFACRCDPAWTERRLHAPDCVEVLGEDAADEMAAWLRDEATRLRRDLPRADAYTVAKQVHAAAEFDRLADSISPEATP